MDNDSDEKAQVTPISSITESTLVAFAKLDVATYAKGPDAGEYVTGANGILPPFSGQPVQGFSAVLKIMMGLIW